MLLLKTAQADLPILRAYRQRKVYGYWRAKLRINSPKPAILKGAATLPREGEDGKGPRSFVGFTFQGGAIGSRGQAKLLPRSEGNGAVLATSNKAEIRNGSLVCSRCDESTQSAAVFAARVKFPGNTKESTKHEKLPKAAQLSRQGTLEQQTTQHKDTQPQERTRPRWTKHPQKSIPQKSSRLYSAA